jgi:hypothetical protein
MIPGQFSKRRCNESMGNNTAGILSYRQVLYSSRYNIEYYLRRQSTMSDNISTLSIINMGVSAALSILAPIAVIVVMGIRKRMNWKAMISGAILFIVFVMILESLLHQLVLGGGSENSPILNNTWLYMLYGGFAAGIFEETARLLCYKFILRVGENESIDTGILTDLDMEASRRCS